MKSVADHDFFGFYLYTVCARGGKYSKKEPCKALLVYYFYSIK